MNTMQEQAFIKPELTPEQENEKLKATNKRLTEKLRNYKIANRQLTARNHENKVRIVNLTAKFAEYLLDKK